MHNSDFAKYLVVDKKTRSVTFRGDKLEVYISTDYEKHGCLRIATEVFTIGILDLVINDKHNVGFFLPAHIHICPSEIDTVTVDGNEYIKLTLVNGDVFMKSIDVVKNQYLAYVCFYEQIYSGKRRDWMGYDFVMTMFQTIQEVCGVNLGVKQVIYEIIFAYLTRCMDDLKTQFRLGGSDAIHYAMPLKDVAHATGSVTAKLAGPYLGDSITASLVNASDNNSTIEDILRA
jgi:hypothetical protein